VDGHCLSRLRRERVGDLDRVCEIVAADCTAPLRIELLKRWEYQGVTQADAEVNLRAILDAVPAQQGLAQRARMGWRGADRASVP
jgi:hypothetical protein